MKKLLILRLLILLVVGASLANLARAWWVNGHATLVEAAAFALPDDMPEFFRKAGKALGHFVGDPDRWKNPSAKFLRAGTSADHFLDLDDVEPMTQPIPMSNVMRDDVVGVVLDRDEVLAAAPLAERDHTNGTNPRRASSSVFLILGHSVA